MGKKRIIFFNCLLMSAIVLSIITASKMTVFFNIPIACSFFIFPISYLSLVVINELGGGKKALSTLLSSVAILIISYAVLMLVINMPNQITTINEANALQLLTGGSKIADLYVPNLNLVISSTIGLLISGLALIGVYSYASKYTFKTITCFLSTLIALLIFNAIYVIIMQKDIIGSHEFIMALLNRFIFSVAWTFIISILFLIFGYHKKEKVVETKSNVVEKVEVKEEKIVEKVKSENKNNKPKEKVVTSKTTQTVKPKKATSTTKKSTTTTKSSSTKTKKTSEKKSR